MFRDKTTESSSGSRLCTNSSCRGHGRQLSKRSEQHGTGQCCHRSKPLDQPWTNNHPGKSSSGISNAFGLSKSRCAHYNVTLWKTVSIFIIFVPVCVEGARQWSQCTVQAATERKSRLPLYYQWGWRDLCYWSSGQRRERYGEEK